MRKIHWIVLSLAIALAGCGAADGAGTGAATQPASVPATAAPAPTAEPTAAPAPTAEPTAAPTAAPASDAQATPASPQPGGGGTSVRPPDALVAAAQRLLAAYVKADANMIVLQSANQRDWPDGALGCPKAGMAYPQVVTPGFVLVFTNPAQTTSYEVHTGMSPAQLVLCADNQPVDLGATAGG